MPQRGLDSTFEDDFDQTLQEQEADEENKQLALIANLQIRNKNNFRIEPLDDYDEYSLKDGDFAELLSKGP